MKKNLARVGEAIWMTLLVMEFIVLLVVGCGVCAAVMVKELFIMARKRLWGSLKETRKRLWRWIVEFEADTAEFVRTFDEESEDNYRLQRPFRWPPKEDKWKVTPSLKRGGKYK